MKKFMTVLVIMLMLSKISFAAEEMPWQRELLTNLGVELIDNEKITRGEFVTMALQLLGFTEKNLKSEEMIEGFPQATIEWAYNILGFCGYPIGTYRPHDYITYEEAVKLCLRAADFQLTGDFYEYLIKPQWPNGYVQLADELGILDDIEYEIGEELLTSDAEKLLVRVVGLVGLERLFDDDQYLYGLTPLGPLYEQRKVFQRYDTLSNIASEDEVEVFCTVPDKTRKYNFYIKKNTNRILGCEPISEQEVIARDMYRKNAIPTLQTWFGCYYVKPRVVWLDGTVSTYDTCKNVLECARAFFQNASSKPVTFYAYVDNGYQAICGPFEDEAIWTRLESFWPFWEANWP